MSIKFTNTAIDGVLKATPHQFSDERGQYIKYYEHAAFCSIGVTESVSETSEIISKKGVFRGLHFQRGRSQTKIVHVVNGSVFDVCVDLRVDSNTFGKYYGQILSGENPEMIIIPAGFAHGFIALEDSVFSYSCIGKYEPELCGAIKWNDPDLDIPWPKISEEMILSEKDKNAMSFNQYCMDFIGK